MATTIHGANPVSVSIRHQTNIVRMFFERGAGSVVLLNRPD
jgi:hypothetical protein